MKKITWTWKKIVTLIGTAFGIGMLVSCYGVPPYKMSDFTPYEDDGSDYEYNDDEENDSEDDDVEDNNVTSLTDIK